MALKLSVSCSVCFPYKTSEKHYTHQMLTPPNMQWKHMKVPSSQDWFIVAYLCCLAPAALISICKFEEDVDRHVLSELLLLTPTCALQTITPDTPDMYFLESHWSSIKSILFQSRFLSFSLFCGRFNVLYDRKPTCRQNTHLLCKAIHIFIFSQHSHNMLIS